MQKKLSILTGSSQTVVLLVMSLVIACDVNALEDPTKPPLEVMAMMPDAGQAQASVLVLNGVKDNGKNSFAIVNNTMVRMGDSYQGYRLIGVRGKQATLIDQGRNTVTLSMDVVDYRKNLPLKATPTKAVKRKHSVVKK